MEGMAQSRIDVRGQKSSGVRVLKEYLGFLIIREFPTIGDLNIVP